VHRNVSLLAIAVLAVHIATSVLDPFAGIHLIDAAVPFVGSYDPCGSGSGRSPPISCWRSRSPA